jgi:hypothetical protein
MGEGRMGKCNLNYHYELFYSLRAFTKCDYPAHVRAAHGLDKVKVSPVIADLVIDEDLISAQTICVPADDAPHLGSDECMHDIGSIMDMNLEK